MLSYDEMKNLMETLTLQEAVVLHRDLWNWIYEESLRIGRIVSKMEYFITFNKWFPISACWFCHYININKDRIIKSIRYNSTADENVKNIWTRLIRKRSKKVLNCKIWGSCKKHGLIVLKRKGV